MFGKNKLGKVKFGKTQLSVASPVINQITPQFRIVTVEHNAVTIKTLPQITIVGT